MSKKVLIKGTLILTTAGVLIKFFGFLFKIFLLTPLYLLGNIKCNISLTLGVITPFTR